MTDPHLQVVVADTNVLINLMHVARLDLGEAAFVVLDVVSGWMVVSDKR